MQDVHLKITTSSTELNVAFDGNTLTIGRLSENKVVLQDEKASRRHCVIERTADGFLLRDLQSRNKTAVNGQWVETAAVHVGDRIQIGSTLLQLVAGPVPKTSPTPPAVPGAKAPIPLTPNVLAELGVQTNSSVPPIPANVPQVAAAVPAAGQASALEELAVVAKATQLPEVADELEVIEDELEVIEDDPPTVDLEAGDPEVSEFPVAVLRKMADAMPERAFDIDQIALINTRGKPLLGGSDAESGTKESMLLFRLVLLICYRSRASDIHVEPRAEKFVLRLRVDGTMLDLVTITRELGIRFSAVVKVLCDLDTTQRNIVQEGHFAAQTPNVGGTRRVDYRVSFVPTLYGQKLVIRVFDAANAPMLVDDLLLPEAMASLVRRELTDATGIILVCGPTGSGKTTTLYSLLRSCGTSTRNIVTIEDPVEVQIEGTTQLPVDDENDKGFAALLKSVLRQDPDVIMVGEIRDAETARIALQAAMTGHLVLSTIHTRDTVGTIFRMLDLGLEPYMVAEGLDLVLAQRLVRRLCPHCRRPHAPSERDLARMGPSGAGVQTIFAHAKDGCPRCLGTGFAGRRAVFECLGASDALRDMIVRKKGPSDVQQLLKGADFVTLAQEGYRLVAEGFTSIEEVERAVGR